MNWMPIFIGVIMACTLGTDGSGTSFFTCTDKVSITLKTSESIISFTDIEKDALFVAQTQNSSSKCSPGTVSSTEAIFNFNFDECEPEVTDGANEISYTFTVWNVHWTDPASPISRTKTEYLKVTCAYAKETSEVEAVLYDKSPYLSCTSTGVKIHLLAAHYDEFNITDAETARLYVGKKDLQATPTAECLPQTQTATEVIIEFAYDKCDRVVEDTANYTTYKYTFRNQDPPGWTRKNEFQTIKCQFPKKVITFITVGMEAPAQSPIGNSVGDSDMNLNMVVSIPQPPNDSPSGRSSAGPLDGGQTIMSGTRLHVDVTLPDEEKATNFVVSLINCYATQSPNDNDEKKIDFIDHSCPADKNDMSPDSLNVISNGEGKISSFEFDSFEWKHLTTEQAQQIYITCLAEKCDENKEECKGNCQQQERFRRSESFSRKATDVLSAGPFYIVGNDNTRSSTICSENSGCSDACVLMPSGKEVCTCTSGRTLLSDYKTCADVYTKHSNQFDFGWLQFVFAVVICLGITLIVVLVIKHVTRKRSSEKMPIVS